MSQSIRVDFYLIHHQQPQANWLTACRLLEKAYQHQHQVFVQCTTQQEAEFLDALLWTYKDNSFIPHSLEKDALDTSTPIHIGYQNPPPAPHDILMNMTPDIPSYFAQFRRIIEIVLPDDDAKAISREHYREYRSHQCQLHTHTIS